MPHYVPNPVTPLTHRLRGRLSVYAKHGTAKGGKDEERFGFILLIEIAEKVQKQAAISDYSD